MQHLVNYSSFEDFLCKNQLHFFLLQGIFELQLRLLLLDLDLILQFYSSFQYCSISVPVLPFFQFLWRCSHPCACALLPLERLLREEQVAQGVGRRQRVPPLDDLLGQAPALVPPLRLVQPLPHLLQLQRGFAACGSSAGSTFKAPAALGAGEPSGGWRVGCGRCLANLKK